MEGSLEGILYYIRGYGTHEDEIPTDPSTFYLKKLGNLEVSFCEKIYLTYTELYSYSD